MANSKQDRVMANPTKSPFNYEVMDSLMGGELFYAKSLEADEQVLAWTKRHGIVIKYRNKKGGISRYLPDFLVRKKGQLQLELVEIKGEHLKYNPDVEAKNKAAEDWCRRRDMKYKFIVAK